jgi:hypothetical protein
MVRIGILTVFELLPGLVSPVVLAVSVITAGLGDTPVTKIGMVNCCGVPFTIAAPSVHEMFCPLLAEQLNPPVNV